MAKPVSLERISEKIQLEVSPSHLSNEKKERKMRAYAKALWEYSRINETVPVFISLVPSHDRIVINVKDDNDKQKLIERLSTDEAFKCKPNQFIPNEPEFYSRNQEISGYEVKITAERRFSAMV